MRIGNVQAGFVDYGPMINPPPDSKIGQIVPTQIMPVPTTMEMPGMVATAQVNSGYGNKPDLTPQDLLKPLPTIVDNQPTEIAQCNSFAGWVDDNPLLAGGLLLGLAWFVFGRKS